MVQVNNVPENCVKTVETVLAYVKNESKGSGTLYVTENHVEWISSTGESLIIKYPDISIFAICKDHEKYNEDCIFMLVKDNEPSNNHEDDSEDSDNDEDIEDEIEIRFAPAQDTHIQEIFDSIQECNKLHNTYSDLSEEEEEGDDDGNGQFQDVD